MNRHVSADLAARPGRRAQEQDNARSDDVAGAPRSEPRNSARHPSRAVPWPRVETSAEIANQRRRRRDGRGGIRQVVDLDTGHRVQIVWSL